MDNLEDFATDGFKVLASETGDLNADGRQDVVLVLDKAAEQQTPDGPGRSVLLLIRDASGKLQKTAQNDRIVPCATCGGMMGDPFGYVRIDQGSFTVVIEGGSRQRWSSEYVFAYAASANDWHLQKVERSASDQMSQESVTKSFTEKDFGQVSFSDFDPEAVPEVVLP